VGHGVFLTNGSLKNVFFVSENGGTLIVEQITPDEAAAYAERAGPMISVGSPEEAVGAAVGHTNALVAMSTRLRHLEQFGGGAKGVEYDAAKRKIAKLRAQKAHLALQCHARDAEIQALHACRTGRVDVAQLCQAALEAGALSGRPEAEIPVIDLSQILEAVITKPFRAEVLKSEKRLAEFEAVAPLPPPGVEVTKAVEATRGELLLSATSSLNVALELLDRNSLSTDPATRLNAQLVTQCIHAGYNAIVDALTEHTVFGAETRA
jgi:hypothetical protein